MDKDHIKETLHAVFAGKITAGVKGMLAEEAFESLR